MNKILKDFSRSLPRPLKHAVKRIIYYGNRHYCPVCDRTARIFFTFGVIPRPNAVCPFCGSRERHRMVWRYFEQETDLFRSDGAKMLHVAPEVCFEPRFRQRIPGYMTADLLSPADVRMDICDIQCPDNSFDIIYCSHVLEHVEDDRRAMREFARVLKPDGWAVFMVPVTADRTFGDTSITDPQERLRLFGQHDHVRRYGPDFADRLREAGFSVKVIAAKDFLPPDQIERCCIGSDDIFHCTKSTA